MTAIPQPASLRLAPPAAVVRPLQRVARRRWTVLATRGVVLG
ncbi:MAG: hypothetical protein JWO31_747, partial [Phycisphaerales bacterium]|nr:hypothetical protein [Phycisphaerales bacterium]